MNLNQTLYKEHLEEMSALYELRISLIAGSGTFQGIANVEKRLNAHLDALIIGKDQTFDVLSKPDDFGELYASVCAFCIQNQMDLLKQMLLDLDYENKHEVKAATDALCYYWLKAWDISWLFDLSYQASEIIYIINQIVKYHELECTAKQLKALEQNEEK